VYAMDAIVSTLSRDVLNSVIFGTKIHDEIPFRSASPDNLECDESMNESFESDAASTRSDAASAFSVSVSNFMIEFIACMCVSVITATISYDGE